jgi:hypothetical protein
MLKRGMCVFCGREGKMTSEHVFPLWTRRTVNPDVKGDSGYVFRGPSGRFEVVPGMPIAALQVKRVCATCNNGWMSGLERKAKPLLTRPIQGDPKIFRFVDVHTVANWAYKTCAMADLASTGVLGPVSFRWLGQRRRPPHGVIVTMAAYGGVRYPQYAFATPVTYRVRSDSGIDQEVRAYLITVSIGHLVFQVFGHHIQGTADLTPSDWKRDCARVIWPPPPSVRWPPPKMLDDQALFRFAGTEEPDAEDRANAIVRYPLRKAV